MSKHEFFILTPLTTVKVSIVRPIIKLNSTFRILLGDCFLMIKVIYCSKRIDTIQNEWYNSNKWRTR